MNNTCVNGSARQVMWAWVCIITGGASTSIIFVAPKVLSRETRVATNVCLSRQTFCRDFFFFFFFVATKYFCSEKTFVTTNICRDKHNFVATKVLSRHAYFCRDQHVFVATKHVFCSEKSMLVETELVSRQMCLSRERHSCRDKPCRGGEGGICIV